MTAETAAQRSSRIPPGGVLASFWSRLAAFGRAASGFCNQLLRLRLSASAQNGPESAGTEATTGHFASYDPEPTATQSCVTAVADVGPAPTTYDPQPAVTPSCATTVEVNVGPAHPGTLSQTLPDAEEIERRRSLVRTLFNEYWNEAYDRPAKFVERLDQAEDYLNARLAAHGELWRLDANARALLGLPVRSNAAPAIE